MNKEVAGYIAALIMEKLDKDTPKGYMCLSNMECEGIENALIEGNLKELEEYIIMKYKEWKESE